MSRYLWPVQSLRSPAAHFGLLVVGVLWLAGAAAAEQRYFDYGLQLFNRKQYGEAVRYFDAAASANPGDQKAGYYAALARHYAGDLPAARRQYEQLIRRFPSSEAAARAAEALKAIGAGAGAGQPGQSAVRVSPTGSSSITARVDDGAGELYAPDTTRIYFRPVRGNLHLDAEVNGRRLEMVFDTGASITMIGSNHLKQLGITPPSGPPEGYASGVGGTGVIPIRSMIVDLKVGGITRRNFRIHVADNQEASLLGQTFFKDFQYRIDKADNSIVLAKKGSSYATARPAHADNRYAVPFRMEHNSMIVTAQINGKSYDMIFDTGASKTSFTAPDLKALNITIPDTATVGIAVGVAGETPTLDFTIDRIKLGPIEKYNYPISVLQNASMSHPLLGQTFYSDWLYTIDNDNQVIHFMRR